MVSFLATMKTSVWMCTSLCKLTSALASAASEWLLIILLFLHAIFSYLVTRFASYCKLQAPCVLCSRLDHLFSKKKSRCYEELICTGHIFKISSLVNCQAHEKLVEAHSTWQSGLISNASADIILPDSNNLLVDKSHQDLEFLVEDGFLVADDQSDCLSSKKCSSCNAFLTSKTYANKSVQTELASLNTDELKSPSASILREARRSLREMSKKGRGFSSGSFVEGPRNSDPLSHVGYTELKITSESESEFPATDDEEEKSHVHEVKVLEQLVQIAKLELETAHMNTIPKPLSPGIAGEKLLRVDSVPEYSPLLTQAIDSNNTMTISSAIVTGHGLEELNWQQVTKLCASPLMSPLQSPLEVPGEKSSISEISRVAFEADTVSNETTIATAYLNAAESGPQVNDVAIDSCLLTSVSMDMNDVYKLAIGEKGSNSSSSGLLTGKDASRANEELKLLLSQISGSRGSEPSWSDMSPRVFRHADNGRSLGASGPVIQPMLPKRISLERNESGFESLDGSIISEIEGETDVDRLKRQILRDRQAMSTLYKELEEERNASAIAANQAMAMINRLQEDKAAIEMEALQYQRMMEEQAEYDQEALQRSNDLLSQKENELQDLEAELETYRVGFENDFVEEKILETMSNYHENDKPLVQRSEDRNEDHREDKADILNRGFQDERSFILKHLREIERKLYLLSNHGIYVTGSVNNEIRNKLLVEAVESEKGEHHMEVDSDKEEKEVKTFCPEENKDICAMSMENGAHSQLPDIFALQKEVLYLTDRLQTLEADREFLEHTMNALRNGNDGIQFVQEIAFQLHELRKIGMLRDTTLT